MTVRKQLLNEKQLEILRNAETTGKLTRKQAAFVKLLLEQPKISGTEAALATYGKPDKDMSRKTAGVVAVENLAKPSILAILNDAAEEAEGVLRSVMRRSSRLATKDDGKVGAAWGTLARQSSNDILDRVHGKATTRIEAVSAVVSINMDLTSTISED